MTGPPVNGQVAVEYSGGPFDGRRELVPAEPDPRITTAPDRLMAGRVATDRSDEEVHRLGVDDVAGVYLLEGPTADGLAYRYAWRPGDPSGELESGPDAGSWVPAPWDPDLDGRPVREDWLWHRIARGQAPRWSTWCGRTVVQRGDGASFVQGELPTDQVCPACESDDLDRRG